jgi:hypothetical protein
MWNDDWQSRRAVEGVDWATTDGGDAGRDERATRHSGGSDGGRGDGSESDGGRGDGSESDAYYRVECSVCAMSESVADADAALDLQQSHREETDEGHVLEFEKVTSSSSAE